MVIFFSLRYLQTEADIAPSLLTIDTAIPPSPNEISTLSYSNSKSAQITKKSKIFKTQRSNSVTSLGCEKKIFDLGVNAPAVHKIKLPALEALKPLQKNKQYKNTYSLDNCESVFC